MGNGEDTFETSTYSIENTPCQATLWWFLWSPIGLGHAYSLLMRSLLLVVCRVVDVVPELCYAVNKIIGVGCEGPVLRLSSGFEFTRDMEAH